MTKVIAVTNHKGGVGKTTTALNLSAAFASMGCKCLMLDLDAQCNLTQSVKAGTKEATIYDALRTGELQAPIHVAENLDLIPSNENLAVYEAKLIDMERNTLNKLLAEVVKKYDLVIIDCPPSMGMIVTNALNAAHIVLIPIQAHYLALQGLQGMLQFIEKVRQNLNPSISVGGVMLTQYDNRKLLHRNVYDMAKKIAGDKVCTTTISNNIALAEAPIVGKSIFDYSPKSKGAADYMALAQELKKKLKL